MPILDITLSQTGVVGVLPQVIYIATNDTFSQVSAAGYLNHTIQLGFQYNNNMIALVTTSDTGIQWMEVQVAPDGIITLLMGNNPGIVTPQEVQQNSFNFALSAGAADAYTVALNPPVTALTDGLTVVMTANHTSTGSTPTLSVNGLTPVSIVDLGGGDLLASDIVDNSTYILVYSLDNNWFTLINPSLSVALTSFVQSNIYNYAADTGIVNVYTCVLFPSPAAYLAGLVILLDIANANTGASTLNANGLGAKAIINLQGAPLAGGEMLAGSVAVLLYNGTSFVLQNSAINSGTGTVNPGTANQLAYYTANGNTVSGLATANDGLLVTSNAGVPSILAGPGTTGQILQANTAAAPSFSTASYPSTAVANELLYASSTNVVGQITTANSAQLVTSAAGVPSLTASMTNGQIVIGFTGGTPVPSTLTAGNGISILNAAGSITLSASGGGTSWTDEAASPVAMVPENGYVADTGGLLTFTLPALAAFGTMLTVVGKGAGGWLIAQNAGQNIQVGAVSSTVGVGGSVASQNRFDSIVLLCTTANTTWTSVGAPQSMGLVIV